MSSETYFFPERIFQPSMIVPIVETYRSPRTARVVKIANRNRARNRCDEALKPETMLSRGEGNAEQRRRAIAR